VNGFLLVRLGPLLRLLDYELRAGNVGIAPECAVPLPPGDVQLTLDARMNLPKGRLDAQLDVSLWIEPGETTIVDLARWKEGILVGQGGFEPPTT